MHKPPTSPQGICNSQSPIVQGRNSAEAIESQPIKFANRTTSRPLNSLTIATALMTGTLVTSASQATSNKDPQTLLNQQAAERLIELGIIQVNPDSGQIGIDTEALQRLILNGEISVEDTKESVICHDV